MARRSKYSRQRQLEQELKQGLAALKDTRRMLREAEVSTRYKPKPKQFARISKSDYRRMMAIEAKFGVYNPKGNVRTVELTPARMRATRKHWSEFENLMKEATFAEYPSGSKPKTKRDIKRALYQAYPKQKTVPGSPFKLAETSIATKRGVWMPRSERQITAPIGQLRYNREVGVWTVRVKRKTRQGFFIGEDRFIGGPEVLAIKQEKLEKRLSKMPKLKRGERLRFIIGGTESRMTFRNMGELYKFVHGYRGTDQARATLLNQLVIETVSKGQPEYVWRGTGKRRKRVKNVWTKRVRGFKASNYHEVGEDYFNELFDYTEDGDEDESD